MCAEEGRTLLLLGKHSLRRPVDWIAVLQKVEKWWVKFPVKVRAHNQVVGSIPSGPFLEATC